MFEQIVVFFFAFALILFLLDIRLAGLIAAVLGFFTRCKKFVASLRKAGEPDFQYKATHWMDCMPTDTIAVMIDDGDVYTERYSDREVIYVGHIGDFEPDRFIPIGEKR